jgi:hypothetical protein
MPNPTLTATDAYAKLNELLKSLTASVVSGHAEEFSPGELAGIMLATLAAVTLVVYDIADNLPGYEFKCLPSVTKH